MPASLPDPGRTRLGTSGMAEGMAAAGSKVSGGKRRVKLWVAPHLVINDVLEEAHTAARAVDAIILASPLLIRKHVVCLLQLHEFEV